MRFMRKSTLDTQINMQKAQTSSATLGFSPLAFDLAFPVHIILDGERDDQAITQMHVHDALEIGCCLAGSGTLYVGAKILPFRQGDITVITDREYHRCRSSPGSRSHWAWFFLQPTRLLVPAATSSLTWEPERFAGPQFANVLPQRRYPELAARVRELVEEARRGDAYMRQNLRCLFVLLINELHRRFRPAPRATTREPMAAPARLAPALELITTRFHETLTIPALARACQMGLRSFESHFQRQMQASPRDYLLRCRVQAAAALLQASERTVAEIAYECGFGSLSSFNRAFVRHLGTTPSGLRKRNA